MPRRCGLCGRQSGGADGAGGRRWEHARSTPPATPGRSSHIWLAPRLPWLVNKTPPERLCNNINNSSYSLPEEKKLKMDRTGKCPVSLQACSNQNENKHLLTVQNGVLSGRAQAAPPLARPRGRRLQTRGSSAGSFTSAEIAPTWKPGPRAAAQGAAALRDEEHTHTVLGGCVTAPRPQKQHLVKPGTGLQIGPIVRLHTYRLGDVIRVVWKMPHVGNVWKEWGSAHVNSATPSTSAQTGR